nr:MAG TPA: hypothetical protein [Caudoviricetes sp.]
MLFGLILIQKLCSPMMMIIGSIRVSLTTRNLLP